MVEFCITAGEGVLIDYGVTEYANDEFGWIDTKDGAYFGYGMVLHSEPCAADCVTGA